MALTQFIFHVIVQVVCHCLLGVENDCDLYANQ